MPTPHPTPNGDRLPAAERGMTVVEVVVAGLILVLGALGVLAIVDSATRNTYRAEQSQVVANVLQREMEKLRQTPYEELALTSLPSDSTDPFDPNSRLVNTSYFYAGRGSTGLKPLVYNGETVDGETIEAGTIEAGPTPFQVGDVRGTVSRYVVWDTCPASLCQDGRHLKRAIVAVSLDDTGSGGERRYQELQGQIVDPDVQAIDAGSQHPGGSDTTPWSLWLTDTPCDRDQREELGAGGSHPSHNTRGDCADGVQAGNVPGAPDLLWPEAPPGETDPGVDFSTDVEPQPAADQGLQLMPGPSACGGEAMAARAIGVADAPDPDPYSHLQVHRWLSPPMPPSEEGALLLTGTGTLSLWTRTIGGVVHKGRICAWLFVRSPDPDGSVTDTMVVNLGPPISLDFEHFAPTWPSGGWTEIPMPLRFGYADEGGAMALGEGARLGLALAVAADTPNGLQLIYDTPSFDSRLQLETDGAPPPSA